MNDNFNNDDNFENQQDKADTLVFSAESDFQQMPEPIVEDESEMVVNSQPQFVAQPVQSQAQPISQPVYAQQPVQPQAQPISQPVYAQQPVQPQAQPINQPVYAQQPVQPQAQPINQQVYAQQPVQPQAQPINQQVYVQQPVQPQVQPLNQQVYVAPEFKADNSANSQYYNYTNNSTQADKNVNETNQNQVNPLVVDNNRENSKINKIIACLKYYFIIASVACLFCVIFGAGKAYGENITIITAMNFLLQVLSFNFNNFINSCLKLFLGILYIVALVLVIKNICVQIYSLKKYKVKGVVVNTEETINSKGKKVRSNIEDNDAVIRQFNRQTVIDCYKRMMKTFMFVATLILLAFAISGEPLEIVQILSIILFLISAIIPACLMSMAKFVEDKKLVVKDCILYMVKIAFIVITLAVAIILLTTPLIKDMIFGLKFFFTSYSFTTFNDFIKVVYTFMVKDILCLIAVLKLLSFLKYVVQSVISFDLGFDVNSLQINKRQSEFRTKCIALLVYVCVIAFILCIFNAGILTSSMSLSLSQVLGWFSYIKADYIPTILLLIGAILLSSIEADFVETEDELNKSLANSKL